MFREIAYHNRAYKLLSFIGLEEIELADKAIYVEFEDEQNSVTYVRRVIGNLMFW